MNYLSSILIALVLCVSSAVLIAGHIRTWKRLQREEMEPHERDFRRRQYRRRMQTSALLGALGVAIFIGQLLMTRVTLRFLVTYWSGVLVLVFWIALLALADMAATSFYYSREKNNSVVEHAKLQGELRRARDEEAPVRNGKPGSRP